MEIMLVKLAMFWSSWQNYFADKRKSLKENKDELCQYFDSER